MREKVLAFLDALGVLDAEESPLLDVAMQYVGQMIRNEIRSSELPEEMETAFVYLTAGQLLELLKGSGQLLGFELDAAEKQVREGDTSVTFALGEGSCTPEQRLDALIAKLQQSGMGQLARFRRLVWE